MMWRQLVTNYFIFSAKERKGIIIIFSLIIILIISTFFYPFSTQQRPTNYSDFQNEINRLTIENEDSSKTKTFSKKYYNESGENYSSPKNDEIVKSETFYFDPNTASFNDWKRLGLRDKTIHTIQNYLSKGGKFYKPEDISKIWGLSQADAQRLIPYVRLKNVAKENLVYEKREYTKPSILYAAKTIQLIDVNTADTSAFISLPGIGSKLSQRIIAFRNKLGGFYSIDQVGETYLLPDSTFQKIKSRLVLNNHSVKQININTASIDEMKVHPYLRYMLANTIFQYRQQHGNYISVEDLKKIATITEETFNKIAPYLTIK